jgi:hypothetical protein
MYIITQVRCITSSSSLLIFSPSLSFPFSLSSYRMRGHHCKSPMHALDSCVAGSGSDCGIDYFANGWYHTAYHVALHVGMYQWQDMYVI